MIVFWHLSINCIVDIKDYEEKNNVKSVGATPYRSDLYILLSLIHQNIGYAAKVVCFEEKRAAVFNGSMYFLYEH